MEYCELKKFYGYFINFEESYHDVTQLKKWLKVFKEKLIKANPEYLLLWYDSLNEKTGSVNYQNRIDNLNLDFLNLTDYFFLNYGWREGAIIQLEPNVKVDKTKVIAAYDVFKRYG